MDQVSRRLGGWARVSRALVAVSWIVAAAVGAPVASGSAAHAPLPIYVDSLAPGWSDWSWSTQVNWQDTTSPHSGRYDVAFTFDNPWDGLSMHSDNPVETTPYDQVQFWINGGSAGGQRLWLYAEVNGSALSSPVDITPYIEGHAIVSEAWRLVDVPLSVLGATDTSIDRLDFFNDTGASQPTMRLDDLSLFDDGKPPPPPKTEHLHVTVDASGGRHPISPYIYGVAFGGSFLKQNHLTLDRWGGNETSRYNWRLGSAVNTANDWYFENTDNGDTCSAPGCAVDRMVSQDRSAGAASLVTVPTLGWVAKNANLDTCGFSVAKYGPQQQTDPYRPNCGNGVKPSGQDITGNDPTDTSVRSTPDDVRSWVHHLVGRFGAAAHGGVKFFAMDNEP
ncbi:MAG TPA: glycoside hydrolase family 44 protein, partial [Chloroflexota bacterium]|nr:glycoside hydrolase family 44 protein [Chloroflexota bacterium]